MSEDAEITQETGSEQVTETPETPETPKAPETVLTAPDKPDTPPPPEVSWRDKMAGENKDFRKRLDRFSDEASFAKSYLALEQKLSSGEYKKVEEFPDKGTDEEKAEWRKINGVPDKPDDYLESLAVPDGFVPGEADKPGLERLAQMAQHNNWSQDKYNDVIAAYVNEMEAQTSAREEADMSFHRDAEDALRADWAGDYRSNVNAIHNLTNGWPEETKNSLLGGRTAEGNLIADHPGILKVLADLAMKTVPEASILPDHGGMEGFKSRMEQLEEMSKDANGEYYKGTNSDKLQAEHLKLIEQQQRMAG